MLSATMRKGWGKLTLAVLGSLIYAVGINVFMVPLGLYTGGMLAWPSCCGPCSSTPWEGSPCPSTWPA